MRLSCSLWENRCLKPSDRCRALPACHQSWLFIRGCRSPAGQPRQAPQLEYMHKLNRHPNSLPYTKQFKWYSLERWQVLMSLSLWQRGEGESHEETESRDGQLLFFFFFSSPHQLFASSAPWALRRGGASTHTHLNKREGWRWRCKELLCFFFPHTCLHHHNPPFWILFLFRCCPKHTFSH